MHALPKAPGADDTFGTTANLFVAGWATLALAVAASGLFVDPPRALVPALIGGSFLAFLVAWSRSPRLRAWALAKDVRLLVLYHVVRVPFGVAFLVMLADGRLPEAFARTAGWGDILAGGLAPLAALLATRRPVLLAWNVIGMADMLLVVATAQRLLLWEGNTQLLAELSRFPFSTIPLFVVPMILMTHVVVFAKLRARA